MEKIHEPVAPSEVVTTVKAGLEFVKKIGYPVVLRPAYTLGGSGGGIAENEEEFVEILMNGLRLSRVGQVLVERCIAGWKEIEYEVMRDANGTCITVCNMENLDPVGVHTGDSIVVAPSQTLGDKEYQMLRTSALNIISELNIRGGCNVQFALHPTTFEYCVIEVNPRVSRSSALASKATGYPIAKVSAKIALGYNLDEIKNAITKKTFASFEPALDYVVVKIPRLPFDKFIKADHDLTTQMKATGEIVGVAPTFFNVDGIIYDKCTELIRTETMRERKQIMEDRSDAFIMVPGGIGTFEEFFEVLTLKQLGRHGKAIIVYNQDGFFNSLFQMMDECVEKGFMNHVTNEIYQVMTDTDEILSYLDGYTPEVGKVFKF